jgi:cytosine/uracil/thiamine/allantoin permease
MLILLCGMAVLVQNGSFHAAAVLLMLLNNLILSALIPIGKNETLGELCLVLLLSCNLIVDFAQLTILFDDAPHQIAQVMSYVIFFCLEVPLLVGCLKHIKRELASAADYMEEAGK